MTFQNTFRRIKNFLLYPGCNISDFQKGQKVKSLRHRIHNTVHEVIEIDEENEVITVEDGGRYSPNFLWPLEYEKEGSIYVDFDNTLAKYNGKHEGLGDPNINIVEYVKDLLTYGYNVKIFTSRVAWKDFNREEMEQWCEKWLGRKLEITNIKGADCILIIDDRCYNVKFVEYLLYECKL